MERLEKDAVAMAMVMMAIDEIKASTVGTKFDFRGPRSHTLRSRDGDS